MVIFFDPFYFIFVLIPTIAISAGVQLWLRSTYGKWSRVPNHAGLTGLQVGQALFGRTGLQPIGLQTTPGSSRTTSTRPQTWSASPRAWPRHPRSPRWP